MDLAPSSLIRIREAVVVDSPGIARVHVDSWRTTYAGILPESYLKSLTYLWPEIQWRNVLNDPKSSQFVYVAEGENRDIVGFAAGGPEMKGDPKYKGELYAIYILSAYQNRGIGSKLVSAVTDRFLKDEVNQMLVWVLSANPARHFYEALGGKYLKQELIEIQQYKIPGISYGWENLLELRDLLNTKARNK